MPEVVRENLRRQVPAVFAAWSAFNANVSGPTNRPIRVAIYDDAGGGGAGPRSCERCLPTGQGFVTQRVKAADIRGGVLDRFDVLIQPGGSGSKQANALEQQGRDNIRKFVEQGGGYLGICAGSYLASANYDWSLGLLDARVMDRQHWARGTGDVQMRIAPSGQELLDESRSEVTVHYGQGPLLAPADNPEIPDYEELAIFTTEIAKNGAPRGVMLGATAAARGTFGAGRVFCFSPHPEGTPGLGSYIAAAVRWTAEKRVPSAVVSP
jgi:hypothetical protein